MNENTKIIELNGKQYQLRKMNAFDQFNFLKPISGILGKAASSGNESDIIGVLTDEIARMPDEVSDKMLFKVFKNTYVSEGHGLGFSPMVVGTSLQYEDLDLGDALTLTVEFFKFNYANFIEKATSYLSHNQLQK